VSDDSRRTIHRLLTLLLFVAGVAYVINLGAASIWDANEAYYVETPREMIESGDYINPTFNYEPRINKPVLSYWIVAPLYHAFGVSVAVQRMAIAAAALAMIGCVFVLTRAASKDRLAPLLAAAALAANPRFFMFARRILIDVGLTALMTMTLTCFAMAERHSVHRRRWLVAMYVSVGLGVLIKGPVALVLPGLVFLMHLAVHRELGRIREMMLPTGVVIMTAIVAPWYVALYLEHGWTEIISFLRDENLERYTSVIGPQSRPVWFYLPVMLTDGLPWSLCFPGIVAAWLYDRRTAPGPEQRIRTLLILWIAVIVAVFSLSQTKQDLYIFPIVAAVTALGADVVARTLAKTFRPAWLSGSLLAAAIVLVAGGAGVLYLFSRAQSVYTLDGVRSVAMIWMAGGAVLAMLVLMRRLPAAAIVILAVPIAFNWTLMLRVLPSFERYKPVVPLSEVILQKARAGDRLAHYDVALPSMVFYVRRHIDMLNGGQRDEFLQMFVPGRHIFAVLPELRYRELREALAVPTCVLKRQETSDVKLRELLAGQPPPAVLLVSTRCP